MSMHAMNMNDHHDHPTPRETRRTHAAGIVRLMLPMVMLMADAAALPAHAQTAAAPVPALVPAAAPVRATAATPARQVPAARATNFPVVVGGVVPDEATRQAILAKVRAVYGADRVVDQLGIGPLVAPPNWSAHVQRMIAPDLERVTRGQLTVRGNNVEMRGEVANEASRQEVASRVITAINNPTYTVRNGLRVAAAGQDQIDAALANRIVEFEPASFELTPLGRAALDQLLPVLLKLADRNFEVIGHTDSVGTRATNLALSAARADAVKGYLTARGIRESAITTLGAGPDRPVAGNDTPDGRARNRRIELRVGQ
jgi:OmpA-OmpF porin, OOP family